MPRDEGRRPRQCAEAHRLPRGPTYSDCGRMIRLARRCSSACAIQPLTRLIANVGVKSGDVEPEAVQEQRRVELDVGLQPAAGLVLLEQPERLRFDRARERVERHVAARA